MTRFNPLRFLFLVLVLIGAAIYVQEQRLRTTSWAKPLEVIIYPVDADSADVTQRYLRQLDANDYRAVGEFFTREARRYGLRQDPPVVVVPGPPVARLPPDPPRPDDPFYERLWWTLMFRIWAWHYTPDEASNFRRVRVFAVYHRPGGDTRLPHSFGIQKGLLGLVHVYADPEATPRNNIVIAHEILHTVGASDKYTADGTPVIPEGLANPAQKPLFPQTRAEIMAGAIALSETERTGPGNLRQCAVGPFTAREIGWVGEG